MPPDPPDAGAPGPNSEQWFTLVLQELHSLAGQFLSRERRDHTLQATELVNEAYLKLARYEKPWQGRTHFFAVAASAVRQVLVDHARSHASLKRGSGRPLLQLRDSDAVGQQPVIDLLALDEALCRLATLNPVQKEIAEKRLFGGLRHEEIARVLGISPSAAKENWRTARAWLLVQLQG